MTAARIQSEKVISLTVFKRMLVTGFRMLEVNRPQIDALNVFPVPDGDTGTNMTLTMQSAINEINKNNAVNFENLANDLANGALKGARGNSGVILSQVLKGFSNEIGYCSELNVKTFTKALKVASDVAYSAVAKPKEGTMLTVVRVVAEYAPEAAKKSSAVADYLKALIDKSEEILAKTPDLLDVLKKAGVVDSGGFGIVCMLKGFLKGYLGEEIGGAEAVPVASQAGSAFEQHVLPDLQSLDEIEFAYCTEFFINNLHKKTTLADIDKLREHLDNIGDSTLVVGNLEMVKVHVHTNKPGVALSYALQLGEVDKIKIENMLQQNREILARYEAERKELGLLTISSGEGFKAIFSDLLVDQILEGGQTMNPSADDIAQAVKRINADSVIILPNNKNIILAAEQSRALVTNKRIYVVPTLDIPQGLAAVLAYNSEIKVETNLESMSEAIKNVKSGAVTYAVRDTKVGEMAIKKGDLIGLDMGKITQSGASPQAVCLELVESMLDEKTQIVTLYYGEQTPEKDCQAAADSLSAKYPKIDFLMYYGGQPLYYYIISVE